MKSSQYRGSTCQNCGEFRKVARNGKLPPHKCPKQRPSFAASSARKVIVVADDMAAAIRAICY